MSVRPRLRPDRSRRLLCHHNHVVLEDAWRRGQERLWRQHDLIDREPVFPRLNADRLKSGRLEDNVGAQDTKAVAVVFPSPTRHTNATCRLEVVGERVRRPGSCHRHAPSPPPPQPNTPTPLDGWRLGASASGAPVPAPATPENGTYAESFDQLFFCALPRIQRWYPRPACA